MTEGLDRTLSAFMDAWVAGKRPRLEDFLLLVDPAERDALADAIDDFITLAPTPAYDAEALAAILVEASGTANTEARPAPMAALLTRVRAAAGLSMQDLAARLTCALDLTSDREKKVGDYAGQLERGELDSRRVSVRVVDAFSRVLTIDRESLDAAARLGGLTPAGARFRGGDAVGAAQQLDRLEALADLMAAPAPEDWDEVDELFRAGR